jgi:hypothetical protein
MSCIQENEKAMAPLNRKTVRGAFLLTLYGKGDACWKTDESGVEL